MISGDYWNKISFLIHEDKKKIIVISIYYLILSLLDVLGVVFVGSFITFFLSPGYFQNFLSNIILLNLQDNYKIYIIIGIGISTIYIIKTFFGLYCYKKIIYFSFNVQARIRETLMNSYSSIDYENYTNTDNSKYIQMSGNMVKTFGSVINALLQAFGDIIIFISLALLLISVNYKIFVLIFLIFLIFYFFYKFFFLSQLLNIGINLNKNYSKLYKNVKEFFIGFKEIKILNLSNAFFKDTRIVAKNIAKLDIDSSFITFAPKYFIELFIILLLVFFITLSSIISIDKNFIISTSSFFIAASIRIIPSLLLWIRLKSTLNLGENSTNLLFNEMKKIKLKIQNNQAFRKEKFVSIEFNDVVFKYKNNENKSLKIANLKINKGDIIGVYGDSGSGKTTFVDLITGLLRPKSGNILLNGKYQNTDFYKIIQFGYVSQKPFLFDDTIRKNITVNDDKEKFDDKLFTEVIKFTNLNELINDKQEGADTIIGEDAIRVSGGQKQRIAIARALYLNNDILILDEPTSSLDNKNAKLVIENLIYNKNDKTIIIISHYKDIINLCEKKIEARNGELFMHE